MSNPIRYVEGICAVYRDKIVMDSDIKVLREKWAAKESYFIHTSRPTNKDDYNLWEKGMRLHMYVRHYLNRCWEVLNPI